MQPPKPRERREPPPQVRDLTRNHAILKLHPPECRHLRESIRELRGADFWYRVVPIQRSCVPFQRERGQAGSVAEASTHRLDEVFAVTEGPKAQGLEGKREVEGQLVVYSLGVD